MTEFNVNEIFYSIQGESTTMGIPTAFIRFTGCNLRCSYCDTAYAYHEGETNTLEEILDKISAYKAEYVCLTGGEPLLQKDLPILIKKLVSLKKQISIETSGATSIKNVAKKDAKRVKIIMDIKTPSSLMADRNNYNNFEYLRAWDEIKFVCGSKEDFDFSVDIIKRFKLNTKTHILFSPISGKLELQKLASWVLNTKMKNIRLQLQLHKIIWPDIEKGV
jgi:7-carboxy-7-deazaguanine synthase